MNYAEISEQWQQLLKLNTNMVAMAFVKRIPTDIAQVSAPAPSACTYWRRGQTELFYATAQDHGHCPIGLMTMGFPMSAEKGAQAESLVGTMASLHYFDPSEVANIPTIKREHEAIVYGPLAQFPLPADLVLALLNPYQMMIASEALGRAAWAENALLSTFGRPACAALPKADNMATANISLGCIGARTYTDMPQDELLLVIPGQQLLDATEKLILLSDANEKLACYHKEQRAAIANQ